MDKAKKKGKGKKGSKGSSEDTTQLITLEEVQARELMYSKLITDLRSVMDYVYEADISTEDIIAANKLLDKWYAYISCEGLPKPYIPPDTRLFFEKLRHFEAISIKRMMDWLLQVDERSILNQDIFRVDFTKKVLKHELRPNLGAQYDKNINLALRVHSSIQYYLKDLDMMNQAPYEVLVDIEEQEKAVGREIKGFIDRYSYCVLSSEASNMEDVDAITAEYCYKGSSFQMHIWTLKNVPILFEFLPEPHLDANLHTLLCTVRIPYSILELNLTIRALHLEFDHYTRLARSFRQEINVDTAFLNAGITDLADCLNHEWDMQVGLQMTIREEMTAARNNYEEGMKELEELMAEQAKRKKAGDDGKKQKKIRIPKAPKEVPMVAEGMYPDIRKQFIEAEQEQFINFLNAVYHPDMLNLKDEEVNLKRYLMLGGIYQMEFVEKPVNFNFQDFKFNMTWHPHNGELLIHANKVANPFTDLHHAEFAGPKEHTLSTGSEAALSRMFSMKSLQTAADDAQKHESKYFVVTFVLPKNLCLWGDPLICHFEDNAFEYVDEHDEMEEQQMAQLQASTLAPSASTLQMSLSFFTQPEDETAHPSRRSTIFGLPTVTHRQHNFYQPTLSIMHGHAEHVFDGVPEPEIEDFMLDQLLTKANIREMEKHVLPRIISSYKFPNELREEESEAKAKKPKGQGGTLMRLKAPIIEDVNEKNPNAMAFSYGPEQNNPERIFPIYPVVRKLNLIDIATAMQRRDPQTFAELILMIEKIKKMYLDTCLKTLRAPHFMPKMKFLRPPKPEVVEEPPPRRQSVSAPRRKSLSKRASQATFIEMDTESLDEPELSEENMEQEESEETAVPEVEPKKSYYAHWTTEHIIESHFDRETHTMTVTTDRLGVFGFAFKRYEHFPFKYWSVEPNENKYISLLIELQTQISEIIVTIITQHVKVMLTISSEGFRAYVTDPTTKFVRFPTIYLSIDEPINDFKELKKRFREKNLNIFADNDARFYIENGYFSEKHLAAEMHTYSCIALHCANMKFHYSDWNRLAKRREIILKFVDSKDTEDNTVEVRIEPEQCTFVEIKELCSDNLNDIRLEYTLTWRNLEHFSDLHHLIVSMYPSAIETRCKEPTLICNLKKLLWNIRPLSFS